MDCTEIYHSHCRTSEFEIRAKELEKNGYHVILDYFFTTQAGDKFARYCYYPVGDLQEVQFSPVKKSTQIDRLRDENLPFQSNEEFC